MAKNAFIGEGKTLSAVELADGDLMIEGFCAVWDGIDAQNENFVPEAFTRSAKNFLEGSAPLCFNHKAEHQLGKILDLKVLPHGLHMKARIDGAIRHSPTLRTIYEQIKRGSIKGLSVGGFFSRVQTALGPRINDVRITEISATSHPSHEKPKFEVVAGKSLFAEARAIEALRLDAAERELAMIGLTLDVAEMSLAKRA